MEHQTFLWLKRIDNLNKEITSLCSGLDLEALNRKPNEEGWSVAQILDHLMNTNQSYFPMLDKLVLGEFNVPIHGRIGFIRRFFGRFILKGVSPTRDKKIKTFPVWEPASSQLPDDIVARFIQHQNKLKSRIEDAQSYIEQGAIIYSPASKLIVYSLSDAFEIIVTHEERHLEQAREIMRL